MYRIIASVVFATTLATSTFAQDDPDALRAAAEAYVNNPVQQKLIDDMLSPEMMMTQMAAMVQGLPEDELNKMVKIVTEEVNAIRPAMEAAMIDGAAETFTLEEINALNDFYSSDVGASVMGKMNPFMQSYMVSLGPELQQMQQNIMSRAMTEMDQ